MIKLLNQRASWHYEVFTYVCSKKCEPNFNPKTDSNKNTQIIAPCNKQDCDLTITSKANLSSKISEWQKMRLRGLRCQISELEGGFGKNSNNSTTAVVVHDKGREVSIDDIRYIDQKGTAFINSENNKKNIEEIID